MKTRSSLALRFRSAHRSPDAKASAPRQARLRTGRFALLPVRASSPIVRSDHQGRPDETHGPAASVGSRLPLRLRGGFRARPPDPATDRPAAATALGRLRAPARMKFPPPADPAGRHRARPALRRSRLPRDRHRRGLRIRQAPRPLAERGHEGDHGQALERVSVVWARRSLITPSPCRRARIESHGAGAA